MSALPLLTFEQAARMMREPLKDRRYRATPLGLEVARYYRWKKNEWGAAPDTLRDYEAVLAKLCLYFADLELADFTPPPGTEHLRDAWEAIWGGREARTRAKVRSVWIDFFEWAVRERGLRGNPARALSPPKKRDTPIETFVPSFVAQAVQSQTYPADMLGVTLILKYGMRRGGIANVRRQDFDLERRLLTVFTKGGRIYPLPIPEDWFWLKLGELDLEAQWQPEQHLIYRQDTRRMKVPLGEADEVLKIGDDQVGYANVTRRFHEAKKPSGKRVHLWWYRCLERAGLVPEGTTSGSNMHRGRHTSATAMQRSTHDLKLTQLLLGHADIRSTARYTQMDTADLEDALVSLYIEDEEG